MKTRPSTYGMAGFLFILMFCRLNANAQLLPELVVQKGNEDAISSVNYSPDGTNIISACKAEGTVKIWETASGRLMKTIASNALNASYSDNGEYILIQEEHQYEVYNAETFMLLFTVPAAGNNFSDASFANNGDWFIVVDSIVTIKNTFYGDTIATISTPHGKTISAQLCADNKRMLLLSADSTASMIDITSDSTLYTLHFPGQLPKKCMFSNTGKYVTIYTNITTMLFETADGNQISTVNSVDAISPDDSSIMIKTSENISIRQIADNKLRFQIDTHGVEDAVYSKDGSEIMVFNKEHPENIKVVDSKTGAVLRQSQIPIQSLSEGLKNKKINELEIFHPDFTPEISEPFINQFSAAKVAISPDWGNIALGLANGTVVELNIPFSKTDTVSTDENFSNGQFNMPLVGDGTGLSFNKTLHNGGLTLFEDPFNPIVDAQYVPAHNYIFTKTQDGLGFIWNNNNAAIEYKHDLNFYSKETGTNDLMNGFLFPDYYKIIKPAAFSSQGDFFSLVSSAGATLWQTEKLKKALSMDTYGGMVNYFAVSPDAKLICRIEHLGDSYHKVYILKNDTTCNCQKEIHTIPYSDFFKNPDAFSAYEATDVQFKNDSRHIILLFDNPSGAEFRLKVKLIKLKDGISLLGVIPPYVEPDSSFQGSAMGGTAFRIYTAVHCSFSKKLNAYIICTNDKIYKVDGSNGLIVKTLPVKLEQSKLVDKLEFDPDVNFAFFKDGITKKVYAVDVNTGKPLYFLSGNESSFSTISFSPDHKRFATLTEDKTGVTIWNVATGDSILSFKGHTTRLLNAVYSADGKFILCCAQDGSYEKRDASTGNLIYTFFLFKDFDYAIILPDGYYYVSSRSDMKYLNFRFNDKLYNFSQFDMQFNRPDKILQALGSSETTLIHAYYAAWLKRITKSGFKEEDFLNTNLHVPDVNLLNKETLPAIISQKKITLSFNLADSLYKITAYTIYINDVPIGRMNGTELDTPSNNSNVDETVTLDSGANKIEISCVNKAGAESRRETFYITYQPTEPVVSKTWFIGIGVNQYSRHGHLANLSYCVKDIRDLATAFKSKYSNIEIDTLMNEDAGKKNIMALRSLLMQTHTEDRVIISFSGHGVTYDDEFYFATPSTDPQSPVAQSISYTDMEYLLDGIPARKKLLLIDACHSGEADPDETAGGIVMTGMTPAAATSNNINRTNNSSVDIIDVRADAVTDNLKAFNIFGIMKAAFVDLRKNNGAVVIAASQSDQQAQENGQFENGVFTSCLLDQLHTSTTLRVSELLQRINECVANKTTGQQPASRQELPESDWSLW